jgi:ComF family protein
MAIFSLGYFDKQLQTILHDLKYNGLKPLAIPLGQKLANVIGAMEDKLKVDFILPVPLHGSRQYKRGFNQAEEIGRALAQELGLPIYNDILHVTRKTRQQARLPAHQREANVRGAFAIDDPKELIVGKNILVIDDVTTTGATLRENERILKQASATKIVAAVAATAR